jgi:hypothetical protein
MKIRIRPDDASMLQMNDWLAELRDDGYAEPPGEGGGVPASGDASPEPPADRPAPAEDVPPVEDAAPADRPAPAEDVPPVEDAAPADRPATAEDAGDAVPAEVTVRAVIGDQLRMPIMWCEMGSCISWHADPAALGEGDARARAISAGWRIDAFDRLACPRCQQTDPAFRASRPVVLWDRHTAIARAARIAVFENRTARKQPAASTMAAAAGWHPVSR